MSTRGPLCSGGCRIGAFLVVEMRFFGGMSVEETAAALDLSVGTVKRDWRLAKAWLARELSDSRRDDP